MLSLRWVCPEKCFLDFQCVLYLTDETPTAQSIVDTQQQRKMSYIDQAKKHLEVGLFDTDDSSDDDSKRFPSSDDDSKKSSSSDDDSDSDDDTSSLAELKPALKKGDRVVAAWWDLIRHESMNTSTGKWFTGKVHAVKEKDRFSGSRASNYGPVRIYDIHFDDGDELEGILDVFVCPEKDYDLENNTSSRDWKGVRNVKDRKSSDRYAKEIGWYVATIGGDEISFSSLYEAMKKLDEYTIKRKKGKVSKSDLNLPNEWKLSKKKKKRGRPKKVDNEDSKPMKKKPKVDMKDIFDDTGSSGDSDEDMEEEPQDESLVAEEEEDGGSETHSKSVKMYTGVYYIKTNKHYRSLFYHRGKQTYAGEYMLKADAAHARDEGCRFFNVHGKNFRGFSFNTAEEYTEARLKEMAARGLSLQDAGTPSEVAAKMQQKRKKWGESSQRNDDADEEESLASDQDEEEESDVGSNLGVGGEQSKYTGVSFIKATRRYRGVIWHDEKSNAAGELVLAADAAHVRDEFCRAMSITNKGFNFNTQRDYEDARAMEITRRGLSLSEASALTEISSKIQTKRTKWGESRQRNDDTDDSPQSSRDDLPLISMKSKRRRSISPHRETVTKTSSDYRGVTYNQREGKHWTVSICYNGKDRFVGVYDLESDAARVYDEVAAILVTNDARNFATKSDHDRARKAEAERLGLSLESIDSFEESMEKAQIYLNSLLSGAENDRERISRKKKAPSPFTPILAERKKRREAPPVENVRGSSKKVAYLNDAMTMKWGRRLPAAGNLFLESYQHSIDEMLGGGGQNSSNTPTGTFASISTVRSADSQEEHEDNLNSGEKIRFDEQESPKYTGLEVNVVGIGEKEKPVERHGNLAGAGHDNQDTAEVELSNNDEKKEAKYTGLTKLKKINRYRSYIYINGKRNSAGDYVLRADAAHARDVFCRSFNVNRSLNFITVDEYEQARAKEIEQRGLSVDAADTLAKTKEWISLSQAAKKIETKKAKWERESRKCTDDLPERKSQSKQATQDDDSDDVSLFSDAKEDEQENFPLIQHSAAVTVAASNVTAATVKPKLSQNLVSVAKEQEDSLEFPLGCHVLWKLQDDSFHRGVVSSAWLDMDPPIQLVYEVGPLDGDGESKQMICASELAFDTHCPVYIKSSPTDDTSLVEGEVLISRTDDTKTFYTILVKKEGNEFQIKQDIPSNLLRFRKITKENVSPLQRVTNGSKSNNEDMHTEPQSQKDPPKQLNSHEKNVNELCDMSILTSNSTIATRDSERMSTPRGRGRSGNGTRWDERSIDIELPNWFVSDNAVKDHLKCKYLWSQNSF